MGVLDNGRPDRRHVSASSEAEVIRKVRSLEKQRESGNLRKAGRGWTLEKWLLHWLENIAEPSVRRSTFDYYNGAVHRYLVPGLGAHRLDRLEAEHVERLYARLRKEGAGGATLQRVHRALRVALNEATRRQRIARNPMSFVKSPAHVSDEIEPFTIEEAQTLMKTAAGRRNGVRFVVALTLGLRKGEALGLKWSDVDLENGRITVRRALQRQTWRHGCEDDACGRKRGADCPQRFGGGLVVVPPKSRAGRRLVAVPGPLVEALRRHRRLQYSERCVAAELWQDDDWVFSQPNGKPIDPRVDHDDWKSLLRAAGVKDARLHDARHTAATMLLVLNIPTRAVMEIMGWSQPSMASRYQHVPQALHDEVASRVANLLWAGNDDSSAPDDPGVR